MSRQKALVVGIGLATLCIGVLMMAGGCGEGAKGPKKKIALNVIGKDDLAGQKEWAKLQCQGYTVDTIAKVFGFEPTMDAVLKGIAGGLPAKSRRVVEETCREELTRNMRARRAKGA